MNLKFSSKSIYIILPSLYLAPSFAQVATGYHENSIAISTDIIGPIFGRASLGIGTLITPSLFMGINGRYYYHSSLSSKDLRGWEAFVNAMYFLAPNRQGIFVTATFGFEDISEHKDEHTDPTQHTDLIGSVGAGYAWKVSKSASIYAGMEVGRALGNFYVGPMLGVSVWL